MILGNLCIDIPTPVSTWEVDSTGRTFKQYFGSQWDNYQPSGSSWMTRPSQA